MNVFLNRTCWFRWIFQILKILIFSKIFWYVDIKGIFWQFHPYFLTFWCWVIFLTIWYFENKKSGISKKFSEISVRDQTLRSQSGQSHWNFNSETPEKSRGVSSKTGGQNGRKIELSLTAHFNLVYFNRDLGYLIVTSYVKTDFLAGNIQWIQMVCSILGHMNYITVHFGQFSCEFSL